MKHNHTSESIARTVWTHHATQSWAGLAEITAPARPGDAKARRIDLLLARPPRRPGIRGLELLAVEVKITRSDFLTDVRDPEKQGRWRELAHRHAFAAPAGLLGKDEIPDGSGLLVVEDKAAYAGGAVHPVVSWEKRAPFNNDALTVLPAWLLASLAYRASWAEARVKGWSGQHVDDDDVPQMRLELARLRSALEVAQNREARALESRNAYRAAAARGDYPILCSACGQRIRPAGVRRYDMTWRHVDKAHDGPCEVLRVAEELARRDADDAAGTRRWLGDPEGDPIRPADDDVPARAGVAQ